LRGDDVIDLLGWLGTVVSLLFYILLAKRHMTSSYIVGILASVIWVAVGVQSDLPSLVVKYFIVTGFLLWGWREWAAYGRRLKNRYYVVTQADGTRLIKECRTRDERKDVLETEFGAKFFMTIEAAANEVRND
jgi:nicotinamide riboside transporter PnuC